MVAVALVIAAGVSRGDPTASGVWRGVGQAALVVGSVLAASGWFYVISIDRYGDPIGGSVTYENAAWRAAEPSSSSVFTYLFDPSSWFQLWREAFGGLASRNLESTGTSSVLAWVGAVLVVAGVLTMALRWWRGRRRARTTESASDLVRTRRRSTLARLVVAGSMVICIVEIAFHVTQNGAPHGRYLAPAIAAYAIGVAAALLAFPRPWGVIASAAVVLACTYSALAFEIGILHRIEQFAREGWFSTLVDSLRYNGAPAATTILVGLLVLAAAGLVAVGWAMGRLDRVAPASVPD
jgi:hypothetical protein